MAKPRIKTQWNQEDMNFKSHYEVNAQPSQTVPDQSMTVLELIQRHASGLPLGAPKVPIYDGDVDDLNGRDIRTLDLSERHALLLSRQEELLALKKSIQEKEKRKYHTGNITPPTPQPVIDITPKE